MATSALTKLAMLFEPEDSFALTTTTSKPTSSFHPLNKQLFISVKALVWVVISIIVGIGIGQL